MANAKGRAVFLDRDGTIIFDHGYLKAADQVRLVADAGEALATLQRHGFALVLISNQSGIGRGLITPEQAEQVHQAVVARLLDHGVRLDATFYCPHVPTESCRCRKPSPEMLLRAAKELQLDLTCSFMVGDKTSDVEAGQRAGCRTILFEPRVPTSHSPPARAGASSVRGCESRALPQPRPDVVACDWTEILRYVLTTQGMFA